LRLFRTLDPRPIILMYHRVEELATDPQLLAVKPLHFAQHLAVLRRGFRVISLVELVEALGRGRFPRQAVVVTIDDGYADNLANAKPLLESFDTPATVFVTTGSIGSEREFWWDELERFVLHPGQLPRRLRLTIRGHSHEWDLGEAAAYSADDFERNKSWHVEQPSDPSPRQSLYRALYSHLHPLSHDEKWTVLGDLAQQAEIGAAGRSTHHVVSDEELRQLGGGVIEIGAHSVTHPTLAALSPDAQRHEIRDSKALLEGRLGHPIVGFAYPHGSYTAATVAAVREAGYGYACTSDARLVNRGSDPLLLPRLVPRHWDGQTFEAWLRSWLG
jgi:peptidoglycan/xylan/chitin deacetylase (PgdA/CDA1 family)